MKLVSILYTPTAANTGSEKHEVLITLVVTRFTKNTFDAISSRFRWWVTASESFTTLSKTF